MLNFALFAILILQTVKFVILIFRLGGAAVRKELANLAVANNPLPAGGLRSQQPAEEVTSSDEDEIVIPSTQDVAIPSEEQVKIPSQVQALLDNAREGSTLANIASRLEEVQKAGNSGMVVDLLAVTPQLHVIAANDNLISTLDSDEDFSTVASKEELDQLSALKKSVLDKLDHIHNAGVSHCCRCSNALKKGSVQCVICKHGVHKSKCSNANSTLGVVCIAEKCQEHAKLLELVQKLKQKKPK